MTSRRSDGSAGEAPRNGVFYYLPKGRVVVAFAWNPASQSWDVIPTVLYEADPAARFAVDWSNSVLSDKHTIVAVDPQTGLLQSANATFTGQSVNSVGSLVGAAPNILPLGPSSAAMGGDFGGSARTDADAFAESNADEADLAASTQVVLDGDVRSEAVVHLASPPGRGPRVYASIRATLTRFPGSEEDFSADKKARLSKDGTGGGIVVRLPVPFELRVGEALSGDDRRQPARRAAIVPRIVMLPDSRHDFVYRMLSRPLVSDGTKVTLSNGMIEAVEQVRPSMLAAVIALPKYLVTSVVPLPVEINQTQQNVSDAQSRVTAAPVSAAGTAAEAK